MVRGWGVHTRVGITERIWTRAWHRSVHRASRRVHVFCRRVGRQPCQGPCWDVCEGSTWHFVTPTRRRPRSDLAVLPAHIPDPRVCSQVVPLKLSIENPPVLAENRVMAEEDMLKLSAERVLAVFWGGYAHEPSETWIELRDGGNFTNHSDDKWNCGSGFTDSPWDEEHFAKKDIKAGDEILDDYG